MTARVTFVVCLFVAVSLFGQAIPPAEIPPPPLEDIDPIARQGAEPAATSPGGRELQLFERKSGEVRSDTDAVGTNGQLLLDGASDVVLKVFTGPLRFLTNTGTERMRINADGGVALNYPGSTTSRLFVQHGVDNTKAILVTHQPAFELGSSTQYDYGLWVQTNENVEAGASNAGTLYGAYFNALATGPGTLTSAVGSWIQAGSYGEGAFGGTVTNAIGTRLSLIAAAGSTITNGYGILIDDVPGTNDWGIYQGHPSDENYFAGKVGIGISTPADLLHLSATANPAIRLTHWDATASTNAIYFYEGSSTLLGFINQRGSAHASQPRQFNLGNNDTSGSTALFAGGSQRMIVGANGNVGIGTSSPTARLHVDGSIVVTSGNITALGGVIGAVYQDVAEWVPATVDMEPGTVVVLNHDRTNEVMPSHSAYDTSVAGVVSAQPGVLLGEAAPTKEQIATTGRVKVRVDATRAPIRVGDLLVTSDVPGTAMRSEPMDINGRRFHQPGTIIGKALEPLESGTGEILVLLSMQ